MKKHRFRRRRPRNLHMVIRDVEYDYKSSLKENPYWLDNDPIATHFLNALQSTFPEGELFFIQAAIDGAKILRQYGLMDEQLEEDLRSFQVQEAHHSKQHRLWTDALIEMGYDRLAKENEELHKLDALFRKYVPAKWRLAITAADEHYTAAIAYLFTHVNQDFLLKSAAPFRNLLLYHAMEEIEHKAVCFDLSRMLSRSYMMRIISFFLASLDLGIAIYIRMKYLLQKDGLWGWRYRLKVWKFFLGRNGLIKGLFPRIIQYFKPSFHPWINDERKGIEYVFGSLLKENQIDSFKYE